MGHDGIDEWIDLRICAEGKQEKKVGRFGGLREGGRGDVVVGKKGRSSPRCAGCNGLLWTVPLGGPEKEGARSRSRPTAAHGVRFSDSVPTSRAACLPLRSI